MGRKHLLLGHQNMCTLNNDKFVQLKICHPEFDSYFFFKIDTCGFVEKNPSRNPICDRETFEDILLSKDPEEECLASKFSNKTFVKSRNNL